eukprot:CAMPEP_0178913190 /NCGR_PEP_ID=MMETSP0786-20121207/10702_1 /TAXON_ID=186022 /ORGANISM="Thalassionema frauenfeldii, Strain CCMP 1798" /LENGTH=815 /DNA_ID=CAMNT_0020585899 /DNA_START=80 /DNA_END=2527 /DNA_ORIENTATION=+
MVEFGLKLEDNKVADWAEYYIDYEKLKAILDRLKTAIERKAKLAKQKPEFARDIQVARETEEHSLDDNNEEINQESKLPPITQEFPVTNLAAVEEKKQLLQEAGISSIASYGSTTTPLKRIISMENLLHPKRFESKFKDALGKIEVEENSFEKQLYTEFDKVSGFYHSKAEESSKRLKLLIDNSGLENSVNSSRKHHIPPRQTRDAMQDLWHSILGKSSSNDMASQQERGSWDESDDEEYSRRTFDVHDREKELNSIHRALLDQYRTIKLLKNFYVLNYTGFVKILKKFNKINPEREDKYEDKLKDENIFDASKACEKLEEKHEKIYANWFCDGNILLARAQLLPKRNDGLQMDWSQLRLGYRLGMCTILTLWVCWDCIWGLVRDHNSTIAGRDAFPVFRACGGLLLLHWFWGISVYVWTRYRINYIFLFDLNPRTVSSPVSIFNQAVDQTLVFLVIMLLYYKAGTDAIPKVIQPQMLPTILVFYTLFSLIFPLRTRVPMWAAIFEVISSPMTSPNFFTVYIADVFTSMVKVFQDIAWTACFMFSGDFLKGETHKHFGRHYWAKSLWYKNILIPLICLFPLWVRFCQCLRKYTDTGKRVPNLPNAAKYAMSQTVTLFGTFYPLYLMHDNPYHQGINWFKNFWICLFVSSSLYSFYWDVFMDWGLGKPKYNFLARKLMFPRRLYYYAVMVADIVLRFMWVLTLVPPQSGVSFELPQYLTAVTMSLELIRRTVWGFFRLENEHRSNANQYRRVDFVPLHFNTGHQHKYNKEGQHVGSSVLLEVAIVSLIVIGISVASVIAAQRANEQDAQMNEAPDF